MGKLIRLEDLQTLRETEGKSIVWTNGVFDLFHAGHVLSLRAAKLLGDVLVVGINSDASAASLKPGRPIIPEYDRATIVASLSCVDHVIIFDERDPTRCLDLLRPDIFTKGEEYRDRPMPERDLVAGYGGRVELLPMTRGQSTTAIINKILANKLRDYVHI